MTAHVINFIFFRTNKSLYYEGIFFCVQGTKCEIKIEANYKNSFKISWNVISKKILQLSL